MISKVVETILSSSREARNNDKELLLRFMEHYDVRLTPEQQLKFKRMPSLETARRIRQKLQQDGKYPADQSIKQHRVFRGLSTQQRMPKTPVEKVERLTEYKQQAISWLDYEDMKPKKVTKKGK